MLPGRLTRVQLVLFIMAAVCSGPISAIPQVEQLQAPVVQANSESLQGRWSAENQRVAEFRGIPFAAAPVGPLRWKAPREHQPRKGPQQAVEFAAACMQRTGNIDWYAGVAAAFGHGPEVVARPVAVSEDCLYLNVWSPSLQAGAKLPVMVFVHGGSNSGGWSYEPNYLGTNLAARGVVVVTVSYRLGVFGFFSHPALQNSENDAVANFALLDLGKAFHWVRQHISQFGGDPDNVTAFGESAGALDIIDLMLASLASGDTSNRPFHRLISQSIGGSLETRQSLAEEQALGGQLVSLLGLDSKTSAERLRAIPAKQLLDATQMLPADHYHDGVVDGRVLTDMPLNMLNEVSLRGVDIMAGSNADEWLMYIGEDVSQEKLESWASGHAPSQQQALLELVENLPDKRRAMDRLSTAWDMLCPSRYLAMRASEDGGRGWVYYFNRQRPGPGGARLGAYHGAELPYVFNTHDDWLTTGEIDRQLTQAMLDYWVQFARTGDPNGNGRPGWPLFKQSSQKVLALGEQIVVRQSDDQALCELLGQVPYDIELEQE